MFKKIFPIVCILFLVLLCSPVFADTLGGTFIQNTAGNTLGIYGDLEKKIEVFVFDIEGQFNRQENVWAGDGVLGVTIDLDSAGVTFTDFRIESNIFGEFSNNGEGEIEFQGTRDLGLTFVLPVKGVAISVGVFGQTGNPFAQKAGIVDGTENWDLLTASIENTNDNTIPVVKGDILSASLKADFDLGMFEIGGRGLLQLTGGDDLDETVEIDESKRRVHQGIFDIGTGGKLTENVTWAAGLKLAVHYDTEPGLEREPFGAGIRSTTFTVGYSF